MIHSHRKTSLLCKMLCHLHYHPWSSLPFSQKASKLEKNPYPFSQIIRTVQTHLHSQVVSRISRRTRAEAQDALLDYLHYTRSLQFTDAEHISKNSPNFLQKLLANVENEEDIRHSITRFLRYHPINEFEPFFESLGLHPSEYYSFLPRDLIFLSDDDLLLDNFHVLCNYGIPRIKIGKFYKEAPGIFRYDYGALAKKFDDYERLGLSKTTMIKLVISCPSLLIGDAANGEFFRVLEELKNLGFEYEWFGGCLSNKHLYTWNIMRRLLGFLNEVGCSKEEVGRLIRENPDILFEDSGRSMYAVIAVFLKLGLVGDEIWTLILQEPKILCGDFAKNIWQCVHFLAWIGMESKDIAKIVSTHTKVLALCSLKKPITVLTRLKVGKKKLCKMIMEDPYQLRDWTYETKVNRMPSSREDVVEKKTMFLLKLGFVENSDEMTKAVKRFRGRGDELQERFDCLVDAGLDFHDAAYMIRVAPHVLNQKKDVIETKIDFLVNSLGYPLESLVAFPSYLCYDIERIKLRFSMYVWVQKQGVGKPDLALSTVLASSSGRYVRNFVNIHPEGPKVWERLKRNGSLD